MSNTGEYEKNVEGKAAGIGIVLESSVLFQISREAESARSNDLTVAVFQ